MYILCTPEQNDRNKMNIAKTSLRPSFFSGVFVRCSLLDIFESISQEWWWLIIKKDYIFSHTRVGHGFRKHGVTMHSNKGSLINQVNSCRSSACLKNPPRCV